MTELIKKYRGFEIRAVDNHFEIWKQGGRYAKCNTAWSCKVYIDELLSP